MSLAIIVEPDGIDLKTMMGQNEEGEAVVAVRMIEYKDTDSGISVSVGPFGQDQWDKYVAYINDPEGESQKAQARARIALLSDGTPPRLQTIPGS